MATATRLPFWGALLLLPFILACQRAEDPHPATVAAVAGTMAGNSTQPIDVAIITVIPEEYAAMVGKLSTQGIPPACAACVNRYAWVAAELAPHSGKRPIQLVVGMIGEPGLTAGALAVQRAIDRFSPRHVLLVGVAGGIPDKVARGDVVVADAIWNYDYGKLDGGFVPRLDFLYRPDGVLLQAAKALKTPWQKEITTPAPSPVLPTLRIAANGSGYKVIENLDTDFVDAVLKLSPDMISVEMEGAGAAAAVEEARQQGRQVGLLMIRGISDIPQKPTRPPVFGDKPDRERWKAYAADAAASFALSLIRDAWPMAPGD